MVENPGPGQYQSLSPTKEESPDLRHLNLSISRISLSTHNNNRESMSKLPGVSLVSKEKRYIDHLSGKLYAKNLQHRIFGKDSPGPGFYNVDNVWKINENSQYFPRKSQMTIPKCKRQLSDVRVDNLIGPNSYQTLGKLEITAASGKKNVVMGREERNFDPMKYSGNNKILILKGLY